MSIQQCRICGSKNLFCDPAGYYDHGLIGDGYPVVCHKVNDGTIEEVQAHSRYAADIYDAKRRASRT